MSLSLCNDITQEGRYGSTELKFFSFNKKRILQQPFKNLANVLLVSLRVLGKKSGCHLVVEISSIYQIMGANHTHKSELVIKVHL